MREAHLGLPAWGARPPLPGTPDAPSLPTSRYNDFLHDPLSLCKACSPQANAENAISARSDLNPANGSYPFQALHQRSHGGIDVKVLPCAPGPGGQRVGLDAIWAGAGTGGGEGWVSRWQGGRARSALGCGWGQS